MKSKIICALVVMAASFSAVALASPQALNQSEITAQEYAVYSAVLSELFTGNKVTFGTQAKVKLLVIKDHTVHDSFPEGVGERELKDLREQLPSISKGTIDDYVSKRKEIYQLSDYFNLQLVHVLVKQNELDEVWKDRSHGWDNFYKRFPNSGGFVGVSRVGFNPEGNQALIYMEHGCGTLCATGNFILLQKGPGGWKITQRYTPWIS